MWELNIFRRLIPAFAILVVGIAMYVGVKYVTNALMNDVYCATTDPAALNPANWGLATWIFGLFGIITLWCFILWAWMIIKGRMTDSFGGEEKFPPKKSKKGPPPTNFPPMGYGGE